MALYSELFGPDSYADRNEELAARKAKHIDLITPPCHTLRNKLLATLSASIGFLTSSADLHEIHIKKKLEI